MRPLEPMQYQWKDIYAVSMEGYYNWIDYGGFERAIEAHNEFITKRLSRGESIYYWSGVHVVEEMQRYGLFDLSPSAIKSSMHNLKRTAYFGNIGLFRLSDEDFTELASTTKDDKYYEVKMAKFSHVYAKSVISMRDYRNLKAQELSSIRKSRNYNRKSIKRQHEGFIEDALTHDIEAVHNHFIGFFGEFQHQVDYYLHYRGVSVFGQEAIEAYAKFLSSAITDEKYFSRFISEESRKKIKTDLYSKRKLTTVRKEIFKELTSMECLTNFSIEWESFKDDQISLSLKPIKFGANITW